MIRYLRKKGLTNKELIVIGFLLFSFLCGLILKYSNLKKPGDFEYSESDKRFEENTRSAFDELASREISPESRERARLIKKLADSLYAYAGKEEKSRKELPPDKKININTALAEDLSELPGIGRVMAERIIEYRESNGLFRKIDELKRVKGIGEKKFESMKMNLTVE